MVEWQLSLNLNMSRSFFPVSLYPSDVWRRTCFFRGYLFNLRKKPNHQRRVSLWRHNALFQTWNYWRRNWKKFVGLTCRMEEKGKKFNYIENCWLFHWFIEKSMKFSRNSFTNRTQCSSVMKSLLLEFSEEFNGLHVHKVWGWNF